MRASEIIEIIENGGLLIKTFYTRRNTYTVRLRTITSSQFEKALKHFGDRLELNLESGVITKHIYKLKKDGL